MHVLVVWEPTLATDWTRPSGSTLARVSDRRAKQFWDPDHLVAGKLNEMAKQKPPQPEPGCCIRKGFYWDEAILYLQRTQWKDTPASAFWDGPVARVIPGLERTLNSQP